ncbi:RNA polymerase I-specific transcription initiation factor RRN6-like protein [Cordyceps militaris CM01]|uniref:RNA polymerase I-specific transcription initiation factor RRN6-like protein n=1 Tax=Cordyceps militaris (strain CM01) TaxID=983644 RepID=G3JSK7_CORMM|nr:RNA polymerase I-specific transcription initiation factor RRN6-like protein [Cordyceps militaris CM01]EGX88853.1 RNA polymerase I-specific transcription initiation factor RRN6-like protein [Cordyceps militaris CM01]
MAEAHGFAGHTYGDAGILSYRLADQYRGDQVGSLESSRHTEKEPRFSVVGAIAELYPPSKAAQPSASSIAWRARLEQQRWLSKSHPEAFMGNFAFQEPLREDLTKFKAVETSTNDRPLLATGSMPTVSYRQDVIRGPVPFLASAVGVSGELLRLSVADQTDLQWDDSRDASLQFSVIDPLQGEKEVTWATDGLPITQVKYVQGLSNQFNVQWLLVQKETSTTVLQPEYHHVPITDAQIMDGSIIATSATSVKPNPILTISHSDTGGNAHSDIVFIPADFDQRSSLALIDECGFWSIWRLMGTHRIDLNTVRVFLQACGHINTGPLAEFPSQHDHPAEKHGLLVVCKSSIAELDPLETDARTRFASSKPILLMWKADRLQAVNIHSATMVSPLKGLWTPEGKNNRIITVQRCPATESRVFILTEKNLVWAEIRNDQDKLTTLLTVPHIGDIGEGPSIPTMTTCALEDGTAMVLTFSIKTNQLSVYWFKAEDNGHVRWHRHVTSLSSTMDPAQSSHISQLTVTPLRLTVSDDRSSSGLGAEYKSAGVEFFQVNMLFDDLSLRHGIYTTVYTPDQEVVLPKKRLDWSMTKQQRQWKKRRDKFLERFATTFVLPDGMTEKDLISLMQRNNADESELAGRQKESEVKVPQPVRLNMERICRSIGRNLAEAQRRGPKGLPINLFIAVQDILDTTEPGSRAPLTTWHQLPEFVGDDAELDDVENGMEAEIQNLFDAADENKVIPQVRRFNDKEPTDSLVSFADLFTEYCNLWLDGPGFRITDTVQEQRRVWVAEVARSMLLSSYGVLVQDVTVFGPQRLEVSRAQSREPASSAMLTSSPHNSQLPQAPPDLTNSNDDALARLSLLAPSLSTTQPPTSRSHNLLSYWPAERGHDPERYVSTVAVASDDKFREARERLQRKEAKRRSHIDKFRLQSMTRRSSVRGREDEVIGSSPGPTHVQAMSSQAQPSSSQTQAPSITQVTMSQPVSGAFGARKKKSKPKRKSGFR